MVNDRSQCAKFRGNPPKELRTAHSSRSKLGPLIRGKAPRISSFMPRVHEGVGLGGGIVVGLKPPIMAAYKAK